MFLSELKLWNFRKYGCSGDDPDKDAPAVLASFRPGLNVLVGENDSGKTAIADAIRHLLGTQSRDWYRLEQSDFHGEGTNRAKKLKIEAVFRGLTVQEAAPFLEWLGFEEQNGEQNYILTVRLTAERKPRGIVADFRAGPDPVGARMEAEARELLRITYLKPLRDAENELTPGRRSRLAQILSAHRLFQYATESKHDEKHALEEIVATANEAIKSYFCPTNGDAAQGEELMREINGFLTEFFPADSSLLAQINICGGDLTEILRRLALGLGTNSAGLGSLNLLYMAAELLLLQVPEFDGLRLGIVEELEAHLHPQAQLRLIAFLDKHVAEGGKGQFILTTHSTTLGASVHLENLIICRENKVFPMAREFTKLEKANYDFLRRFLDATKANIFFARGVILVEGDAENLLLPTLAEIINRPLHRYGVSVVNVGSTAFLHYARVFVRKDGLSMGIPVAVVTDMDVKPEEWVDGDGMSPTTENVAEACAKKQKWAEATFDIGDIRAFVSGSWTLEYDIALDPTFTAPLYKSILWAEKVSNAKTGEPQDGKAEEVRATVKANLKQWGEQWADSPRKREKIAYEIYRKTMLDRGVSKAIIAQLFSRRLAKFGNKEELAAAILRSKHFSYLVDAICHVTKPRNTEVSVDSDL